MIEIRHLHLVKEIAEAGNMTKAAARLFLTQPSLSHQLKDIESRLGVALFLRVNKTLVLTPAGQKLLNVAGEVIPKVQGLERSLKDMDSDSAELRVSTNCYTCYQWLPALMNKFRQQHTGVEIDIVTEAMVNPVESLLKDKIDVAISNNKTQDRGVFFDKLFDDEQILLVHESHPLAKKSFVSPHDFKTENLIMYQGAFEDDFFCRKILIPAGISPVKVTKMQLTEARVELVKAGAGIAVLSRWLIRRFVQGSKEVKQIRIGKSGFYRTWYLVTLTQKKSIRHIRAFNDYLKKQPLGS
ncbi:MAG TPA: LysR substrate-binding domain-containing protein [Chryseosolibacter sp.]|nr:LysR substrate-binding domain-containing protein [Chryseosolibacter sp.]